MSELPRRDLEDWAARLVQLPKAQSEERVDSCYRITQYYTPEEVKAAVDHARLWLQRVRVEQWSSLSSQGLFARSAEDPPSNLSNYQGDQAISHLQASFSNVPQSIAPQQARLSTLGGPCPRLSIPNGFDTTSFGSMYHPMNVPLTPSNSDEAGRALNSEPAQPDTQNPASPASATRYRCTDCNRSYKLPRHFRHHVRTKHIGNAAALMRNAGLEPSRIVTLYPPTQTDSGETSQSRSRTPSFTQSIQPLIFVEDVSGPSVNLGPTHRVPAQSGSISSFTDTWNDSSAADPSLYQMPVPLNMDYLNSRLNSQWPDNTAVQDFDSEELGTQQH